MSIGRIDVHSHLLPGVDDGCRTVDESIACAKKMVEAGYTHSFCTPHIWPSLDNAVPTVAPRVAALQKALDAAKVPLKLMPGGEMHVSPDFCDIHVDELVTYNNKRRFAIFDFWAEQLPSYFAACLKHLRNAGLQPILAHPERIEAIQSDPASIEIFMREGLLIQCNLEPLGDTKLTLRRQLAERWLLENRYFMLGSDLHRLDTLDHRLRGLRRATELVGEEKVWELTHTNPSLLM